MHPHERQQFDFLLATAVDRWIERLTQRQGGLGPALAVVRSGGTELHGFVEAFFRDFLLEDCAGACFILQSLERRPVPHLGATRDIGNHLLDLAKHAFAEVLRLKTEEAIEQRISYQSIDIEEK